MKKQLIVHPIGWVYKTKDGICIEIESRYSDALLGLESFSHILVLYWFHENDNEKDRNILQVRPRRNPRNPLTGVFATHAPVRPNLIAVSTCRIKSIDNKTIWVDDIDARDRSPVVDIKCYIPEKRSFSDVKMPEWV